MHLCKRTHSGLAARCSGSNFSPWRSRGGTLTQVSSQFPSGRRAAGRSGLPSFVLWGLRDAVEQWLVRGGADSVAEDIDHGCTARAVSAVLVGPVDR